MFTSFVNFVSCVVRFIHKEYKGFTKNAERNICLSTCEQSINPLTHRRNLMNTQNSFTFYAGTWMIPVLVVCSLLTLPVRLTAEELKPKTVHVRPNVAHRGHSFIAPENTLASYRAAIKAAADGGECDVYRSADGVVFLSHDKSPKRTMGGDEGDLTQMTFEQIRQFDAGSWKGEKFKGEKVPTLDEYLKLLKDTTCHPVVEIKQVGIEADVLECIRKNKMVEVTTIIAFGEEVVREIRRLEPKICVAWLYSENLRDKGTAEENADRLADLIIQRCRSLDVAVIDLGHGLLSPKLVKLLNEADIHVWAWTVNDESAMRRYLDWGVVSITTDKPDLLAKVLKEHKDVAGLPKD